MSLWITIPEDLRLAALEKKGGIGKGKPCFSFYNGNINDQPEQTVIAIFPKGIDTVISESDNFKNSMSSLSEIPSIQIKSYFQKTIMTEFSNILTWLHEGFTAGRDAVNQDKVGLILKNTAEDFIKWSKEIIYGFGHGGLTTFATQLIKNLNAGIDIDGNPDDDNINSLVTLPYFMAVKLLGTTPNGIYVLPYIQGKESSIYNSNSGYGYKQGWESSRMFSSTGNSETSHPLLRFLTGTVKVQLTPYFLPYGDSQDNNTHSLNLVFDLFNDCRTNAENNLKFILTFVGNNMWVQNGIVQGPGSLYDVNIPGIQRLYMCTCSITVTGKGITRKFDYIGHEFLLPDIFTVSLTFTPLISNNFNSFIYDVYLKDIDVKENGITINAENTDNAIEKFIDVMGESLKSVANIGRVAEANELKASFGFDKINTDFSYKDVKSVFAFAKSSYTISLNINEYLTKNIEGYDNLSNEIKTKIIENLYNTLNDQNNLQTKLNDSDIYEIIDQSISKTLNEDIKDSGFTLQDGKIVQNQPEQSNSDQNQPEQPNSDQNQQKRNKNEIALVRDETVVKPIQSAEEYSKDMKSELNYEQNKDNGGNEVLPPITDSYSINDIIQVKPLITKSYSDFRSLDGGQKEQVRSYSNFCYIEYNRESYELPEIVKSWLTEDFILNENEITPLKPAKDLGNYSVSIYQKNQNEFVIVSNGSNDTTDWQNICTHGLENLKLNSKFEFVKTVVDNLVKNSPDDVKFHLCGHGIGGTIAQHTTLAIDSDKIIDGHSFNSLGFDTVWLTDVDFKRIHELNEKIKNIRLEGDVISSIGLQLGYKYQIRYSPEDQMKDAIENNRYLIQNNNCYPNLNNIMSRYIDQG